VSETRHPRHDPFGAVLIATVLGSVAVGVLRRELRIRRRIADTDGTLHAPRPPGGATRSRVGPGERTPVPPATTARPGRLLAVVPTDSSISWPVAAPAPTHIRPSTSSGGVA